MGGQAVQGATWTVWGAGRGIWGTTDRFHFAWQVRDDTASISARVVAQTETHRWAKAGVMIRDSAAPGAPYVAMFVTPRRGIVVQYRTTADTPAHLAAWLPTGTLPIYLRLTRRGAFVVASLSRNGLIWVPIAAMAVPLRSTALAGLAVTSHRPDAVSVATFDAVTLAP